MSGQQGMTTLSRWCARGTAIRIITMFAPLASWACLLTIDDSLVRERPSGSGGSDGGVDAPNDAAKAGPPPGLVGYWSFDGDDATFGDDAFGRHNGALFGLLVRAPGVKGQALELGGNAKFSVMSLYDDQFPSEGMLAFHFLAKALREPRGTQLFDELEPARNHLSFVYRTSVPQVFSYFQGNGNDGPVFAAVPLAEWHFVVITWTSSQGELFIDGKRVGAARLSSFLPREQHFSFGGNFVGLIDEVALYDRVFPEAVPLFR